jgi:hypothetical protein
VAPAFSASADFAIDKPAGQPCPNLSAGFRCGIHDRLRERGFPGCVAYDCFGAGQQVAQVTYGGRDWRGAPDLAPRMFAVFGVMRQLHELLWYLTEALRLAPERPLSGELRAALDRTGWLTGQPPEALLALDPAEHRSAVNVLLKRTSELVREPKGAELAGRDLIGRRLTDLRGANLRGAYLIGADLRGADLRLADLTGTDLRGSDLTGADLTGSIFLTQAQLDTAKGGASTRLPPSLTHPARWLPQPQRTVDQSSLDQ